MHEIIYTLKLMYYLLVQADIPWHNSYMYKYLNLKRQALGTVLPAKSDSDFMFCLSY